ncbi:hypothetical protein WI36_21885 [Burkholderia ubonensis]|nr:hypothetical protein WI31_01635 [Burkholderia ubonensis]KUZ24567.1 hypothetical protein WI32_34685 [Burkholderia ubonensis]KUZ24624.1 hypothetical protein WI29_09465 [Burkholderia ubonensis]KUZ25841.1 hypothetical protein WI30_26260 [Burkholderia ubonensis]KUZ54234.1 hypothetical protein WI34_24300 [Burkholderia ubonensis]
MERERSGKLDIVRQLIVSQMRRQASREISDFHPVLLSAALQKQVDGLKTPDWGVELFLNT